MQFFFFVATIETGMPECARLVKPERVVEAARRLDKHLDLQITQMPTDPKSFFLRPSNVANEPRAAITQRRVGSIWMLDGRPHK